MARLRIAARAIFGPACYLQMRWPASIPSEAMIQFSSLFRISPPPFPTNFSHSVENFSDFTFFRKISWKFWWPFLVIDYKFCIPLFFPVSLFHYISPLISRKLFIIFPSNFTNFFPSFREIYMFFTYFMRISFPPFFDHDAFMHHTMHWTPLTVMIVTNILINLEL